MTIRRPTSSFSSSSSSDVLLSSSDVKEMARKITTWRRSEGGRGGRGRGGGGGVGGSGGSGTKSIVEVVVEEIDPTSMGGGGGRGAGGGVTGASTFTLIQRITKRLDSRKVKYLIQVCLRFIGLNLIIGRFFFNFSNFHFSVACRRELKLPVTA